MEENGGGDGNSSVAELEVRVEALEGTAADHEIRISTTETHVSGKIYNLIFNVTYVSYACKTEGENGISCLISETA